MQAPALPPKLAVYTCSDTVYARVVEQARCINSSGWELQSFNCWYGTFITGCVVTVTNEYRGLLQTRDGNLQSWGVSPTGLAPIGCGCGSGFTPIGAPAPDSGW
jgi:hypothetical protein